MSNDHAPYKKALEFLLAPTALVNASGEFLFANQAFANTVKVPISKLNQRSLAEFLQSETESLTDFLGRTKERKTPLSSGAFELAVGDQSRVVLSRFAQLEPEIILVSIQEMQKVAPELEAATDDAADEVAKEKADTRPRHLPPPPGPPTPPPPPAPSILEIVLREEVKKWKERYESVATQLEEQATALQTTQDELTAVKDAAANLKPAPVSNSLDAIALLTFVAEALQNSVRLAEIRQYVKDSSLLISKLYSIIESSQDDKFSLIQLNIATLIGFTNEQNLEILKSIVSDIDANMRALRQGIKKEEAFFARLREDLLYLERVTLAIQQICGGELDKPSDDPVHLWQEYVVAFRSELIQHCQEIGKPVSLIFNSTHAVTGKDLKFFDRVTKALISRAVNQGIEPPSIRAAAGKKENGHVMVTIERRGSYYIVQVQDDGTGIGLEDLYRKGIEWGILEKRDIPMDPDKIVDFLITPKIFSEAGGRLTHLPAIKTEVEAQGGFLRLERSSDSKGTKFVFDWLALESGEYPLDNETAA